ncbi:MAG: GIY-YIG nuclease family protein, partial [Patescibacteria group bacterium]
LTNNSNHVLYTGVTNYLIRRVWEHRENKGSLFTSKYKLTKLVYYEQTNSIESAILREKQIKGGSRKRKLDLINSFNPDWKDIYKEIAAYR